MIRMQALASALLAGTCMAAVAHAAPQGARVEAMAPTASVDFEVFLPLRDKAGLEALLAAQQTPGSTSYHHWLTPAQFGARFGPTQASFARVSQALTAAGLRVTDTHTRSLHVAGAAAQASQALGTHLSIVTMAGGHGHVEAARMLLPAVLQQEKVVVAAFSGVAPRHTNYRKVAVNVPDNRYSRDGGYNYNDLKQAYNYPSYQTILPNGRRLDGTGARVAVLMANDALDSDIAAMFDHEHFTDTTGLAPPTIEHLPIDGGAPFDPDLSAESSLDVQQVLGGAPGASVTLVNIPDLYDQHILDGYVAIVDRNRWDIVSSSFGGCELGYTAAYNGGTDYTGVLEVYHEVFQQGNAQGLTFMASSGDEGGLECPSLNYFYGNPKARFIPSVSTPADDTAVTAVGGTNLITTTPPNPQTTPATLTSKYVAEYSYGDKEFDYDPYGFGTTVTGGYWGAGGGRSAIFAQPAWQNGVSFGGGRIVPDVGMQVGGCPSGLAVQPCGPDRSYVITVIDGTRYGLIGTSVSSPEFAGALALAVEAAGGRMGNINPFLWTKGVVQDDFGGGKAAKPALFFHKSIPGYDGHWSHSSTSGFDYMVGNGTANVRTLFGMTAFAPAGDPQTPSNP